ncbi:MAG: DUF3459 domain-containing protein, partial [Bdellovibrionaceae bacterium]|nr:DUF3459 domain-containing protein [Pseudobdellovibrionaceae bacterium]
EIIQELAATSRDNARTPMQWTSTPGAGFTEARPWLGINPNYVNVNVEAQKKDPNSILNFYKKLIRLRRENPVLIHGKYELLWPEHPQIFAYVRASQDEKLAVVVNLTGSVAEMPPVPSSAQLILSNYPERSEKDAVVRPFESRIYSLTSSTLD